MSEKATLHLRLKVLVARTFKAEKLYASMRQKNSSGFPGTAMLSEMANDTRAREWQSIHNRLRASVNDILNSAPPAEVADKVGKLRDEFAMVAAASGELFEESLEKLIDSSRREEFVHAAKKSLELIQIKARLQAAHAVSEELSSILTASGKNVPEDLTPSKKELHILSETALGEDLDQPLQEEQLLQAGGSRSPNVIPFSRNNLAGSRTFRKKFK